MSNVADFSVVDAIENEAGKAIQEGMQEGPREVEREMQQFQEDVECWWAERNGGDGMCARRERDARRDECYQSQGYWDYNTNDACYTREQACAAGGLLEVECQQYGGVSWDAANCSCQWSDEKYMMTMLKYEHLRTHNRVLTPTLDSLNEYRRDEGKRDFPYPLPECDDKPEGLDLLGYPDIFRQVGEHFGGAVTHRQGFEAFYCLVSWGILSEDVAFASFDYLTSYAGENDEFLTSDEIEHAIADLELISDEDIVAAIEGASRAHAVVMQEAAPVDTNVQITVDVAGGRAIEALEQQDMAKGQEIFTQLGSELGQVFEQHKDTLDSFARQVEETDKQRAQYLLDTIADGVKINGVTVREMVGDENIPRVHNLKAANYDVRRMLQEAVPDYEPDQLVIDFTVHADVQQWADQLWQQAQDQAKDMQEMEEKYHEKFEDLEREYRHEMEDYFEEHTMPILNDIGDIAKRINDTMTVTEVFPTAAIALADIAEPQPAAQESNNLAYSGAAFGVIAVLAAGAIYKSCRTRKTNSNEESLL